MRDKKSPNNPHSQISTLFNAIESDETKIHETNVFKEFCNSAKETTDKDKFWSQKTISSDQEKYVFTRFLRCLHTLAKNLSSMRYVNNRRYLLEDANKNFSLLLTVLNDALEHLNKPMIYKLLVETQRLKEGKNSQNDSSKPNFLLNVDTTNLFYLYNTICYSYGVVTNDHCKNLLRNLLEKLNKIVINNKNLHPEIIRHYNVKYDGNNSSVNALIQIISTILVHEYPQTFMPIIQEVILKNPDQIHRAHKPLHSRHKTTIIDCLLGSQAIDAMEKINEPLRGKFKAEEEKTKILFKNIWNQYRIKKVFNTLMELIKNHIIQETNVTEHTFKYFKLFEDITNLTDNHFKSSEYLDELHNTNDTDDVYFLFLKSFDLFNQRKNDQAWIERIFELQSDIFTLINKKLLLTQAKKKEMDYINHFIEFNLRIIRIRDLYYTKRKPLRDHLNNIIYIGLKNLENVLEEINKEERENLARGLSKTKIYDNIIELYCKINTNLTLIEKLSLFFSTAEDLKLLKKISSTPWNLSTKLFFLKLYLNNTTKKLKISSASAPKNQTINLLDNILKVSGSPIVSGGHRGALSFLYILFARTKPNALWIQGNIKIVNIIENFETVKEILESIMQFYKEIVNIFLNISNENQDSLSYQAEVFNIITSLLVALSNEISKEHDSQKNDTKLSTLLNIIDTCQELQETEKKEAYKEKCRQLFEITKKNLCELISLQSKIHNHSLITSKTKPLINEYKKTYPSLIKLMLDVDRINLNEESKKTIFELITKVESMLSQNQRSSALWTVDNLKLLSHRIEDSFARCLFINAYKLKINEMKNKTSTCYIDDKRISSWTPANDRLHNASLPIFNNIVKYINNGHVRPNLNELIDISTFILAQAGSLKSDVLFIIVEKMNRHNHSSFIKLINRCMKILQKTQELNKLTLLNFFRKTRPYQASQGEIGVNFFQHYLHQLISISENNKYNLSLHDVLNLHEKPLHTLYKKLEYHKHQPVENNNTITIEKKQFDLWVISKQNKYEYHKCYKFLVLSLLRTLIEKKSYNITERFNEDTCHCIAEFCGKLTQREERDDIQGQAQSYLEKINRTRDYFRSLNFSIFISNLDDNTLLDPNDKKTQEKFALTIIDKTSNLSQHNLLFSTPKNNKRHLKTNYGSRKKQRCNRSNSAKRKFSQV
jgi:hypothetical protein